MICPSATGNHCVSTGTDNENCGDCGVRCSAGEVCSGGGCSSTCIDSQVLCTPPNERAYCAMLATDGANCGSCGNVCDSSLACIEGKCAPVCSAGQKVCVPQNASPYCTDVSSDPNNCGACGQTCGANGYCSNGGCACTGTLTFCGACIDTQTDVNNCGSCGSACASTCSHGHCVIDTGVSINLWVPTGLLADASNVYFSDDTDVKAFPNGGGTVTELTSGYVTSWDISSLVMDGPYIYFVDGGPSGSKICKVSKTGGTVMVLGSVSDDLKGLAVDSNNVYAHGASGVYSISTVGGSLNTLALGDSYIYATPSIATDGTTLYWLAAGKQIASMPVGGGSLTTVFSGTSASWLVSWFNHALLFLDGAMYQQDFVPFNNLQAVAVGVLQLATTESFSDAYIYDGTTIRHYDKTFTPIVDANVDVMAASTSYVTWVQAVSQEIFQVKVP
jgi:hypothetical protein